MSSELKPGVSKRVLRSMKARWERDLAMLEAAYPVANWEADYPELETIRNLATAIAQIDGIITGTNQRTQASNALGMVDELRDERDEMLEALKRIEDYALAFPDLGAIQGIASEAITKAEGRGIAPKGRMDE